MSEITQTTHKRPAIIIHKDMERGQRPKRPRILTVIFSALLLIALIHFLIVLRNGTPTPPITDCPGLLRTTDYTQVVHLDARSQEMAAIQSINSLAGGEPATLVQVAHTDASHTLDIYVFGCTMQNQQPTLSTLLTQRGLVQGTVEISKANTLITTAQDTGISAQSATVLQPFQQNIYREYSWQHGAFVQLTFPALYPVTSRNEAEELQQQANNNQSLPWSDPLATAEQMAKDLLKWTTISTHDTIVSNDGTTAQVNVLQDTPPMTIQVTLKKLLQHDSKGLWFVTGAQTSGISLNTSKLSTPLSSPFQISGSGAVAGGQTTVTLFDHTLTPLASANGITITTSTDGTYTGSVPYANSMHNQPGLLLVQSQPAADSNQGAQMLLVGVILH